MLAKPMHKRTMERTIGVGEGKSVANAANIAPMIRMGTSAQTKLHRPNRERAM